MNRTAPSFDTEPIARARAMLPDRIRGLVAHADFLLGVDPVFAGLHRYTDTDDGRSYRSTAHTAYGVHQDGTPCARRQTTIVVPEPKPTWIIVHELGHALDEATGFGHIAEPVTKYARTNRHEAFAEAFVAWLFHYGDRPIDPATEALFKRLAWD